MSTVLQPDPHEFCLTFARIAFIFLIIRECCRE